MSNRYPGSQSWAFLLLTGLVGGSALAESSSNQSALVDTYYGAFSTAEPIAVPIFHGLEPSLRLSYSSAGGGGAAGVGWGLEGFSTVGRASSGKGVPRYDGSDLFLLDGQELGACTAGSPSPSCTTGGTHATRIESYQRIKFDAAANTWTVWRKDGTRQAYVPLFQTAHGTYRWGVSSVTDTSGNTVNYGWWCDGSPVQECYPDSISYNGTLVKLYREARPDPVTYGTGSNILGATWYRLKTVDVTTSGRRVRAYQLTYTTSSSSGRSLLQSVRQYGSDATLDAAGTVTGGSSMPATALEYQTSPGGLASSAWMTDADQMDADSYDYVVTGDFNGDGRTDIAQTRPRWNAWKVRLSTGNGFTSLHWGTDADLMDADGNNYVITGDFNGDGKTDIAHTRPAWNGWRMRLSTGNGFTSSAWMTDVDQMDSDGNNYVVTGDFNGDGKTDIAHTRPRWNAWKVRLSTGNGFTSLHWGTDIDQLETDGHNRVVTGDFNGDGKTDIAYTRPRWNAWKVRLSTGNGFTSLHWGTDIDQLETDGHNRVVTGDFNGDGKTDIAYTRPRWNAWKVRLSTGNGFTSLHWGTDIDQMETDGYNYVRTGDFNGDGKTDIAHTRPRWNAWKVRLSTGNGFNSLHWGTDADIMDADSYNHVIAGDLDGDGKTDLAHTRPWWNGWRTRLSSGPLPDLLSVVRNSLGGVTRVQYSSSSAWSNTYLPEGFILQTVSAVTQEDGRGASSTTRYQYQGGLWSSSERRFLGFRKVTSVLDAAGNYTETYYHQHVGCISKPEVTYYRSASGGIFKYSTFGYSESVSAPFTSLMTERWEYECNLSASCRRTLLQIGYDQYGNGYLTYEHGDYDVAGDERTSLRGLYPNTGAYVVGLHAYENIYAGVGTSGTLLKQTLNEYDGSGTYAAAPSRGLLTRQRNWNNQTGGYVNRSFGYDAWGNLTSETDERGYTRTMEYDATYRVQETRLCNALGQCSTKVWDGVLGLVKSQTDINGNVTTYTHDALGRPVGTQLPNGSTETFAYLDWGNPGAQRVRRTVSDGTGDGLWMEVYEDGLGRQYKKVKEGGFVEESLYSDGSTRVWKKSAQYGPGETPRYQVFSFDGLGRLRTITNPDGTLGQRVYGNGYVTSYDELNREKVVWTDAYGQTTQVREKNGSTYQYTTYKYDLLGNLVRVTDAAGNATTVSWDSLGRKLAGCDPDTGCSSYTYDEAGHILTYRDAKGQVSSFTYDALGRRLTKTLADGKQVRWTYDEAGHGAGKGTLTSVVEPSGSESRNYDSAGRVTSLTKCVTGVCYTSSQSYDVAGRLARVTYPDGEAVTYGYDTVGRLGSVSGYVNAFTYNGRGQLLTAAYANGTTARFTYADARQWMTEASVTGPSGTLYQASYGYDAGGRVTSTSSATNPLSNLGYGYDALNRLTSVSGNQSQAFSYDALGNITWNSQVGNYQYADGTHRHAATVAGANTYTYDVNGHLVSGGGRTLTWDADNRLASVTTASGTTAFAYDATGQRVVKSGPSGVTRYFGALVELGSKGLTKHYYAGPLLVAKRDASGPTWYHQDHLGSVRALTNQSGQKVASYDYSAFGATLASSSSVANSRGYGGHEVDDTGLVYMNARYYDPQLGRFISPDALVPSSGNPQALNRYAYVYNNPISNTDPTGHVPVVAAIATAVSVGVATGFTGAAFVISVVGAATVTAGYVLKDPTLMSIGGVLLGASSAYVFGAGFLGDKLTAQAAWAGGTVSSLTSPVSPLDSNLKQAIGWAYTAQSLFYEFKHLDENIKKGAEKLREKFSDQELRALEAQRDALVKEGKLVAAERSTWKPWQKQYGEAMEIATGGALKAGEAIALNPTGGLVGPDGGLLTQVLDVATGWIPGVRAHGVLHDAGGFLVNNFKIGPGYLYVGPAGSATYNFLGLKNTFPGAGQVEGLTGTGGQSVSALFPRLF
ncbi:FG-GAP-like repeat-containing protein [Archangium lansingense]|uniref:FG-GAP-like repeat-containing protein n=1 Tax=Archangium lansingense TaxID=2995310 RepID=UPI003B7D5B4E